MMRSVKGEWRSPGESPRAPPPRRALWDRRGSRLAIMAGDRLAIATASVTGELVVYARGRCYGARAMTMQPRPFPAALPHGALREVLPGLFFVTGTVPMPGPLPVRFSRNMTVVREGERL